MAKEPFAGPVMELFHENEVEDTEDEAEDLVDEAEVAPESLTVSSGSSRSSRESGVESMMEMETALDSVELEDNKVPEITVTEAVEDEEEPEHSMSRSSSGQKRTDSQSVNNDIDSPFEKFNTVYV